MTPSELKRHVEATGKNRHFFDWKTMRFFGDTMKNFGVTKTTISTIYGEKCCWELYRKKPVKSGKGSFFFDVDTFESLYKSYD